MSKVKKRMVFNSPQIVVAGFAGIIFLSAGLLTLPISSQTGEWTNFLDCLFTTTSATCVTGLTTLNTAEHWSLFGQIVIMICIETGGLGFMAIPVLYYFLAGRKISLSTRMILQESLNLEQMGGGVNLMRYILKMSLIIQGIGVAALAVDFVPRFGVVKGLWFSLFHAISSFCNAGFDLFGDSLVPFQNNPWVLTVISLLIIAGGLGFLVWSDVMSYHKRKRLSLHSKIALLVTAGLLLVGTVGFLLTEDNASHLTSGTSGFQRFFNTFFMAVTPRTAGYYSVDYFDMTHAGLVLTMVLMFIGGTSGSTAGGLKTTTFGVLLVQMKSICKGSQYAEFSGRRIPTATVIRALTLFFITLTLCILSTMILSVTEKIPNVDQLGLEYLVFEVVSAFGTVGLTMGITPDLSTIGKLVIIGLMFIGRVGFMTVVFALISKANKQDQHFRYPEETVMIG